MVGWGQRISALKAGRRIANLKTGEELKPGAVMSHLGHIKEVLTA